MDLEELRGFLAVVETGSLLGAATQLGIPRGTLRRRIDSLEARAGVPLLERNARGVTVTEAGALLAERGRRLIEEGAALLAAAREIGREPMGRLRLHLPIGLPPSALVAFIELGRVVLPKVSISMHIREDPLAGLLDDVDLALHFGERETSGPWIVSEVMRAPIRLLASPGYLEEHGCPQILDELKEHTLASWVEPGSDGTRWPLRSGGSIEVSPVLVSNDPHMLRIQARAGVALVFVPDADLNLFGLPVDELVPVLDDVVGSSVSLSLSIPEALVDSPKVSRVVSLFREFLSRSLLRPSSRDNPLSSSPFTVS